MALLSARMATLIDATSSTWSPSDGTKDRDYVFIVNPKGANGTAAREWKKIYPHLCLTVGKDWNVCQEFTSKPHDATEIARKAICNGAAAVIAVGGDGTLNEVVNGFFDNSGNVQHTEAHHRTALGLIPLGTGSDFTRTFGWNSDPYEAIRRVARGQLQPLDVGHLSADGKLTGHYFINVADVHLSANAGLLAAKYKRWGNLCYVLGALEAFFNHRNQDLDIRIDNGSWEHLPNVTAIALGNGRYYGGGMKITPGANPFGGDFQVVILQEFKWYHFLLHLFKLYNGTHTTLENVLVKRACHVEIRKHGHKDDKQIMLQADGEHMGFLPATFEILPGAINLLV